MDEEFDIPLLNNIADALSITNAELQAYFDVLYDGNVHYPYPIKQVILNLSSCMELLIKFRLLEEHWAFLFDDINKAKKHNLDIGNFVSVSFAHGIERLQNLCGIDTQKYFNASQQLQRYRNKIVHFTLNDNFGAILNAIEGSISDISFFASDEIVPYIENYDAIKDIENELNELKTFQKNLQAVIADNK
ncbi:hypothetical protein [Harryflintia acetispora]|uniref:Uncharacterized protein n=1 Tax=Harryflintia acetispora TaxID=1849041 RepID=A0A9X8UJ90_9FIRM|nr:hypothetical protein [Harryflintia acetispora]TCL43417.1 hypothetical protein EDD78_10545 [Harryflintia acetispora]